MTNQVSFPGLFDAVFNLNTVAFSLGRIEIKWYGLIITLGVLAAMAYTLKRSRQFNTNPDEFIDVLIWSLPIGLVGARLYFVINSWELYAQNPLDIFKVWEGGLAIYGGIIAGFLTCFIYCKIKKIDFISLFDLASMGFLIGQSAGRWGNFVNAEAFGGPTNLIWGMSINGGPTVHPTFLYESLWNIALFIFLHFYSKRRRFKGEIFLYYIGLYGLGRFFIEGLRTDSLYLGNTDIRISQLVALACVLAAAALLIYFYVTKKGQKPGQPSLATPQSHDGKENENDNN